MVWSTSHHRSLWSPRTRTLRGEDTAGCRSSSFRGKRMPSLQRRLPPSLTRSACSAFTSCNEARRPSACVDLHLLPLRLHRPSEGLSVRLCLYQSVSASLSLSRARSSDTCALPLICSHHGCPFPDFGEGKEPLGISGMKMAMQLAMQQRAGARPCRGWRAGGRPCIRRRALESGNGSSSSPSSSPSSADVVSLLEKKVAVLGNVSGSDRGPCFRSPRRPTSPDPDLSLSLCLSIRLRVRRRAQKSRDNVGGGPVRWLSCWRSEGRNRYLETRVQHELWA